MDEQAMTIRLPRDLYEWLRREAFDTRESMNSILVASIEDRRARHDTAGSGGAAAGGQEKP